MKTLENGYNIKKCELLLGEIGLYLQSLVVYMLMHDNSLMQACTPKKQYSQIKPHENIGQSISEILHHKHVTFTFYMCM